MRGTKIPFLGMVVMLLAVHAVGLDSAAAADPPKQYVLKFNHVLAPTDPYHPALLKWAKAVEARTNGNLKIQVFPSAQLGVEEDILEQIRQGANVGQNTDAARLGTYVKDMQVMNGPYFVETLDEVQKLNTLPIVKGWKEEPFVREARAIDFANLFAIEGLVSKPPIPDELLRRYVAHGWITVDEKRQPKLMPLGRALLVCGNSPNDHRGGQSERMLAVARINSRAFDRLPVRGYHDL